MSGRIPITQNRIAIVKDLARKQWTMLAVADKIGMKIGTYNRRLSALHNKHKQIGLSGNKAYAFSLIGEADDAKDNFTMAMKYADTNPILSSDDDVVVNGPSVVDIAAKILDELDA